MSKLSVGGGNSLVLMLVVMLVVVVADMEKVDFCLQADLWVLTGKN